MTEMTILLKSKFEEFSIEEDIASKFLKKHSLAEKGLYRGFTIEELPSDECFRTLAEYEKIRQHSDNKTPPDEITVAKLLTIPYSQVCKVKEKIADLFAIGITDVDSWYNTEMIFVNEDTVDKLFEYFTAKKFPKDTLASFFISALISGADESVKLVDAAFELLGDYTYEIMCENFFYPYSYPIGLIKYLMQNGLDAKQTAGILKENSLLFLFFRINENNSILHGHNQTYIDEVLKKYSE